MRKLGGTRVIIAVLFAVSLLFSGPGCGKKAAPHSPERTAPSAVVDLKAQGEVKGVLLSWQPPATNASGDELINLKEFVVRRNVFAKDERPDYEDLGTVQVKLAETGGDQNAQYSYLDSTVEAGKRYESRVVPVNDDGIRGPSNSVLRVTFVGQSSVIEVPQ